jgi:hypothetical protein
LEAARAAGLPDEMAVRLSGDDVGAVVADAERLAAELGIEPRTDYATPAAAANAALANAKTPAQQRVALAASSAANGAMPRDLINRTNPATGQVQE